MIKQSGNYLFLNKILHNKKLAFLLGVSILFSLRSKGQEIGNYVSNGSFENYYTSSIYQIPYYWGATDSLEVFGQLLVSPSSVPLNSYTYQWPWHGKNYLISLQFCPTCGVHRGYPRNRLKEQLQPGKQYCVSIHVNLSNQSTDGIDALGAFFGDNSIDTISKCNDPITYLTPQIQNATNNIITDTLNWVLITGTFVASGTEKYMLIGNFKSDANTNTILVNPTNLPTNAGDYLFDGISVIEVNLSAYAGIDKIIIPGDSAFIGRVPDFAIDPGCTWYKFPNMSTPINTISGMWVKPTVTTTYIVRQILDCSTEKWDTVVIYMNPVGLEKLKILNDELKIFPVPAKDFIELKISNKELWDDFKMVSIYNSLGQFIKEESVSFKEQKVVINTSDLAEGVYSIQLKSNTNETVSKRFVISK